MNKNQEGLERIIADKISGCICSEGQEGESCGLCINVIKDIVQVILSTGYVKLSEVELDKSKIREIIENTSDGIIVDDQSYDELTEAIAQARPIKVKEEK